MFAVSRLPFAAAHQKRFKMLRGLSCGYSGAIGRGHLKILKNLHVKT